MLLFHSLSGQNKVVISEQLEKGLTGLSASEVAALIIAYEPVRSSKVSGLLNSAFPFVCMIRVSASRVYVLLLLIHAFTVDISN